MNVQVQVCGLLLLLVLAYFYGRQKKMLLNTEKVYRRIFEISLLNISLDISSVVLGVHNDIVPEWVVLLIIKAHLLAMAGIMVVSLMYLFVDLHKFSKRLVNWAIGYCVSMLIGAAFVMLLPVSYYADTENGTIITSGGAVTLAGILFVVTEIIIIYLLRRKREIVTPGRLVAMKVWMCICVVAQVIEAVSEGISAIGFASALGAVIIYLKQENPEMNIENQSGMFNGNALRLYLRELYESGSDFSVLNGEIEYVYTQINRSSENVSAKHEIYRYLKKIPDAKAFRTTGDSIWLVFEDGEKLDKWMEILDRRFERGWGTKGDTKVEANWMYIRNGKKGNCADDLIHLIKYARKQSDEKEEAGVVCLDDTIIEDMYNEMEVENLIKSAIKNDRIKVFYQPIYSTKKKRFNCAEALVRIEDEEGNLVMPGRFIEIAEKNGLILKLGEIVFRKVCEFISTTPIGSYGIDYIEINLSVVQCATKDLAYNYIKIMKEYNVNPRRINLEITESASYTAKKTLLDNMNELIEYGVRFSLDDFGTGQSNLNYIVDMPVDVVKFDYFMTKAFFENKKAHHVMDAAVRMVHGLNLNTVSEGVETKEQFEAMKEMGIEYIQGYYFSKPLEKNDFMNFIRQKNIA